MNEGQKEKDQETTENHGEVEKYQEIRRRRRQEIVWAMGWPRETKEAKTKQGIHKAKNKEKKDADRQRCLEYLPFLMPSVRSMSSRTCRSGPGARTVCVAGGGIGHTYADEMKKTTASRRSLWIISSYLTRTPTRRETRWWSW